MVGLCHLGVWIPHPSRVLGRYVVFDKNLNEGLGKRANYNM